MTNWTIKEQKALDTLDRAFKGLPKSIRLYTMEGEITACKVGVASDDFSRSIHGRIIPCAMISDIHGREHLL